MAERTSRLIAGFQRSAELYPERPALEVGGRCLDYAALSSAATAIAQNLVRHRRQGAPPLTAVLASRSVTAYAGVLGALVAGHGYVPLNPAFPLERTMLMLRRSECPALVVDSTAAGRLGQLLEHQERPLLVLLPEVDEVSGYAACWPRHRFVGGAELDSTIGAPNHHPTEPDSVAYLLFTSGTTGVPKGVAVSNANVTHFVDTAAARYEITQFDRFSQTFDLTFDLSVFDMFVAWERGGCVCCPSRKALLNPAQFIRESRLSVWFSVPSVAALMKRLGALKPGAFPTLRWSLFCGEALPQRLAAEWSDAAPNAGLENLYGPTEATIACAAYRWERGQSAEETEHDLVPIGYPLREMRALVVDETLREVAPGIEGELLMSGPQLSLGYWREPDRTAAAFVRPPGEQQLFYRTGDRVCRMRAEGPLLFRGRADHQIKVQGYRVELLEIEAMLRKAAGVEVAVAVGWPATPGGAAGIEAFVTGGALDGDSVRQRLKSCLPPYAVPRKIHLIERWPLNSNGKIDRQQLLKWLEAST